MYTLIDEKLEWRQNWEVLIRKNHSQIVFNHYPKRKLSSINMLRAYKILFLKRGFLYKKNLFLEIVIMRP